MSDAVAPRRPFRLAIIGDTQHYHDAEGRLCALEPVVAQLDRWADLVDELVICAPLDPGPPPVGFAPYGTPHVRIEPLRRAGGNTLLAKLGMIRHLVPWARATRRVARQVDAVHLRCPCNIGLVAILSTWRAVEHSYALYAGVWRSYAGEPRFFALQRRLLATRWFGGPVSVYSSPDPQRPHLEPFFSPSFSADDWADAAPGVASKLERLSDPSHSGPWRAVVVGRLTPNKNQQASVRAVAAARDAGVDLVLDVIGDGPQRAALEALSRELGIEDAVRFLGSLEHGAVLESFAHADLHLLTTRQEGYGKVLLEGMVHATVPIFSESPVAAEISGGGSRGVVVDPADVEAMAEAIVALVGDRERWTSMSIDARAFAATVTLDAFEDQVADVLARQWGLDLRAPAAPDPARDR
ncbi:hypothetical protein BH24ACT4_BH24ACT4_01280 [soil metagenome]